MAKVKLFQNIKYHENADKAGTQYYQLYLVRNTWDGDSVMKKTISVFSFFFFQSNMKLLSYKHFRL